MPNPLSPDIRARFRRLYETGLSGREISRRLLISAASASRLAQKIRWGESLTPMPNPRKTGHGRLVPYIVSNYVEAVKRYNYLSLCTSQTDRRALLYQPVQSPW